MSPDTDINKKIEKAKHELEHMIDLNPSLMLLVNNSGTIIRANKALLDLLHITDYSNILNKHLTDVFVCDDPNFLPQLIQDFPVDTNMESTFTINNNQHLLRFTIIGSSTKSDLFALIINDITSENEQASKKEKEHKKEAVKALMGALLHNVNQPLTVIMMRSQLMQLELEKGKLEPDALANSLRDIMRLTTDIADLLRQLEQPSDYVTTPYSDGVDIIDINKSAASTELSVSENSTAYALILALETHEPGARRHAETTSKCARHIAELLGLGNMEIEAISKCALLHDVGKLGLPKHILQKPGPLTEEENLIMQKHPQTGYDLLINFPFLHDEADAALAHAECFDGSGYPKGLAGSDISKRARIIAVADAYSALTEKRSYKDAVSPEDALKEISSHAGTQFDPKIVNALLNNPGTDHLS